VIGRLSYSVSEYSTVWYSYNYLGDCEWNLRYSNIDDTFHFTEYNYDQSSKLISVAYEPQDFNESFFHYYEYDSNKRLKRALTSREIGVTNAELQVEYFYNILGQVVREELGENLQGLDYVYTINGALKSMNNPEVSRDPGKDGFVGELHESFAPDVFGYTLYYFENDYRRNGTSIQCHLDV